MVNKVLGSTSSSARGKKRKKNMTFSGYTLVNHEYHITHFAFIYHEK
jgi:hypothetical protein